MLSEEIKEFLEENDVVNRSVYDTLIDAIDAGKAVIIYVQRVSGKTKNAVFKPKGIKLLTSGVRTRPVVIGNKIDGSGQFVQYYVDSIYEVALFNEEGNVERSEDGVFDTPHIFKNSKFEKWGHFK